MKLLRIIPDGTKFPFMHWRRYSFPLSALLSIIAVVLFFTVNMNYGIDFTGGTLIEMRAKSGQLDIAKVRSTAEHLGLGEPEVQAFGGNVPEVSMRFPLQPGGDKGQQVVVEKARAAFINDFDFRRVEVVGPRVSGELVQAGTIGVVVSIIGVLIYLWFRFEWQFALGAVIATLHDLVMTIGFYSLSQIEFNMTSIAAILTIVGYSLNDTVVVFDRIRELLRRYKKMPIKDLLDLAINQTLARTFLVSFTAMLALLALVMFGGTVISSFSWAMLVGVVVGTYSSIFIAAPVLIYLGLKVGGDEPRSEAAAEARAAA
ncbi:MAG TPA: protein translocase subunit SecF [Beijerinckiaceae bacterium]|nr:protein translocase subunit SecF [Beijerinckiaceae bacterium]